MLCFVYSCLILLCLVVLNVLFYGWWYVVNGRFGFVVRLFMWLFGVVKLCRYIMLCLVNCLCSVVGMCVVMCCML